MRLPFGLIKGGGISWPLRFGLGCGDLFLQDGSCRIKSASSTGGWLEITKLKLDPCAASSGLVGDGRETGLTADCESVEDDRRLSPEREVVDSHQLDSSSLIEAGDGGYCCPMDASEFDSASPSDKEAGPSSSRATEKEVDCGRFSVADDANSASHPIGDDANSASRPVAEEVDSVSCLQAKVLDSMSPSVAEEVDSETCSVLEEVDSASGSEVGVGDEASGSEVEEVNSASGSEVDLASGSEV